MGFFLFVLPQVMPSKGFNPFLSPLQMTAYNAVGNELITIELVAASDERLLGVATSDGSAPIQGLLVRLKNAVDSDWAMRSAMFSVSNFAAECCASS
jgi:hypothetical protein